MSNCCFTKTEKTPIGQSNTYQKYVMLLTVTRMVNSQSIHVYLIVWIRRGYVTITARSLACHMVSICSVLISINLLFSYSLT